MDEKGSRDLESDVREFLHAYGTEIASVTKAASNVFEAVCFVIFARYYERIGYRLAPRNLVEGKFRFRYSTNGLPWRYSHFAVYRKDSGSEDGDAILEIWHNQKSLVPGLAMKMLRKHCLRSTSR